MNKLKVIYITMPAFLKGKGAILISYLAETTENRDLNSISDNLETKHLV